MQDGMDVCDFETIHDCPVPLCDRVVEQTLTCSLENFRFVQHDSYQENIENMPLPLLARTHIKQLLLQQKRQVLISQVGC